MSKSFIEEARKEHARLQAEWQSSPLFHRMLLLEQLITAYDAGTVSPSVARRTRATSEGMTKEQEIIRLALACIDEQGGFAHKRMIHRRIEQQGLQVSDAALSAYLSKAESLAFDKTSGWTRAAETMAKQSKGNNIVPLDVSGKREDGVVDQPPFNVQQLWTAEGSF